VTSKGERASEGDNVGKPANDKLPKLTNELCPTKMCVPLTGQLQPQRLSHLRFPVETSVSLDVFHTPLCSLKPRVGQCYFPIEHTSVLTIEPEEGRVRRLCIACQMASSLAHVIKDLSMIVH
jgi:hypothetical protein